MEEAKEKLVEVRYVFPADVDAFMRVLPSIVGAYAQKHDTAATIRDLSIRLARDTVGQLVALGICARTTTCLDNHPLAAPGPVVASSQPAALGNNNGHGLQGAMVSHQPTVDVKKVATL